MKYKVLLTGENSSAIDDFFLHMESDFDAITTSNRKDDITRHLELFEPDIFIYCINAESVKDFNMIYTIKGELKRRGIPLAIIGPEDECRTFARIAIHTADIILVKPLAVSLIAGRINEFLDEKKKIRRGVEQPQEEKQQPKESDLQEESAEVEVQAQEQVQVQEKKRHHILVVDDDPRMLRLVSKQLNRKYDVSTAISGKSAMNFLSRKQTDLILLDYEMPGENGPTILKMIRENSEMKDMPVVFLTGMTEKRKIQEVFVMKPQGYLLKPIDVEKLFKVIADILGES